MPGARSLPLRRRLAQLATRYRGFAAQCLVVAQHQHSAGDRLTLTNMAQAWVALADRAEKNKHVFMAYEQTGDAVDIGKDD